jgi:hypothetical protein
MPASEGRDDGSIVTGTTRRAAVTARRAPHVMEKKKNKPSPVPGGGGE